MDYISASAYFSNDNLNNSRTTIMFSCISRLNDRYTCAILIKLRRCIYHQVSVNVMSYELTD